MNLATHAITGVVIQKAVGDWRKAFPIAFISHMFLDGFYPKWHQGTPLIITFDVLATAYILYKWRECFFSILAACYWDWEWVVAWLIGCPLNGNPAETCSTFHRFFLWNGWRHTPWFGLFEMTIVLMTLLLLRESRAKETTHVAYEDSAKRHHLARTLSSPRYLQTDALENAPGSALRALPGHQGDVAGGEELTPS